MNEILKGMFKLMQVSNYYIKMYYCKGSKLYNLI